VPESPRGRDLVVHDKGTHHVDILRVVEIDEPEAVETESGTNGPGS
jgi:hypothetical protein